MSPRSKEDKMKDLTLDDIKKDYGKYGYLEDYQVEWLIGELATVYTVMLFMAESAKKVDNRNDTNIYSVEITEPFIDILKEKMS